MSGLRCLGSSWEAVRSERRSWIGHFHNELGALQHRKLAGIADVRGQVLVGLRQCEDAFDLVAHVAEAAGLQPIAINR